MKLSSALVRGRTGCSTSFFLHGRVIDVFYDTYVVLLSCRSWLVTPLIWVSVVRLFAVPEQLHTWEASRLWAPLPSRPVWARHQMFAALLGKSCWRHSGQRAREPSQERTPAGTGTFPSALLARSPALPRPSVPKKHFEIKRSAHHSLHGAAVTEARGKGGRRPRKKSLCQVEPVSLRGKIFWQEARKGVAWMLQCMQQVRSSIPSQNSVL